MVVMYSVEPDYDFPLWPIAIIVVLLLTLIFMLIKLRKKNIKLPKHETVATVDDRKKVLIKEYSSRIKKAGKDRTSGKIGERECYGQLSLYVREFVTEMTGINVKSYTYEDIKQLENPKLTELIGEFYGPEFSVEKFDDEVMTRNLQSAIDKTLKLLKNWK